MARRLTQDQIDSIWANRLLTRRDNAKRANCSLGMVAKVLAGTQPDPAPSVEPLVTAEPDAVIVAEQLVAGGGSSEDELRASLSRLQNAGRLAQADKDVARMVSVERVSMQILQLLEKLKPAPVADVNAAPDMIAAAARFRERAHAVLDRILQDVPK